MDKEAESSKKERLFSDHAPASVSFGDVKDFLDERGYNHRDYFHYTKLSPTLMLLDKKQLFLTKGSELNDLQEFKTGDEKKWECCYLACFTFGTAENIAMWKMYGGNDEKTQFRLGFKGSSIRKWLKQFRANPVARRTNGEEIRTNIEEVSLHDVAYCRNNSLQWGRWLVTRKQLPEVCEARRERTLTTYVKNIGWAYESEVRLVIRFERPLKRVKTICVDFSKALQDLRITQGPMSQYNPIPQSILANYPAELVSQSEYADLVRL